MSEIRVILYASDMGKGSRPAFRAAIHQAAVNNAQVVYLHAMEAGDGSVEELINNYMPEAFNASRIERMFESLRRRIEQRLNEFHDEEMQNVKVQSIKEPLIEVVQGKADRSILEAASRFCADLIVMGDRTSSSLSRVFLGSTAQRVIHHSNIPVLIVPLEAAH